MAKNKSKFELYVRQDIGSGPTIVLLHGLFADGTQWVKIADLLKDEYRVIVVDLLGHGRSPRPADATFGPEEHVEGLRAALERIGATQNVTLVGYSMGGAVALSYCAEYQQDIEQLYLISTPFYLEPEQMIAANYASAVLVTKISSALFGKVESMLESGGIMTKAVSYGDNSAKFHAMIGANDNKLEPRIIKASIKQLVHDFDFTSRLQKITVPVTFYAGKKDPFIVQGQLYALRQFSPYMDIERLDIIKIDHMLVQNLPHEITELITKNNQRLLYVGADQGTGDVLVLIHGIESSSDYWDNIVPALAEHRRVITIDLLGFGQSPKPLNVAYSLDDQVAWIERTLKELGITEFDLAGHSLGSLAALAYTANHPLAVKSLTMFSPVLVPEQVDESNFVIQQFKYLNQISDAGYLYSHTAHAIGDKRINKFIPSLRSVENSVKNQQSRKLAAKAAGVPTTFIYGTSDKLVDATYVRQIAEIFTKHTVISLPGQGHNFPLFSPLIAIKALDNDAPHQNTPAQGKKIPVTFAKQLVSLAAPVLWLRSMLYIVTGLLLFTDYAPTVLTIGLALYVIVRSYRVIKGAFSLRNEGLSYLGYILLGLFGCLVGYGLLNHAELTFKISVFVICGIVITAGIVRLIAALAWTRSKLLRRSLLISGGLMTFFGALAFTGTIASIYIIVYSIAVYLLLRGVQYGSYVTGAFAMAYIRGFNKN